VLEDALLGRAALDGAALLFVVTLEGARLLTLEELLEPAGALLEGATALDATKLLVDDELDTGGQV
jgi:hypothetical protein